MNGDNKASFQLSLPLSFSPANCSPHKFPPLAFPSLIVTLMGKTTSLHSINCWFYQFEYMDYRVNLSRKLHVKNMSSLIILMQVEWYSRHWRFSLHVQVCCLKFQALLNLVDTLYNYVWKQSELRWVWQAFISHTTSVSLYLLFP